MCENAPLQLRAECAVFYNGFLVALQVQAGFRVGFRHVFVKRYNPLAAVYGLVVGNGAFGKLSGSFGVEHHDFFACPEICVVPQNVLVGYAEFVGRKHFGYRVSRHFYVDCVIHRALYVAVFYAWLMFVAFKVHPVAASRNNSVAEGNDFAVPQCVARAAFKHKGHKRRGV